MCHLLTRQLHARQSICIHTLLSSVWMDVNILRNHFDYLLGHPYPSSYLSRVPCMTGKLSAVVAHSSWGEFIAPAMKHRASRIFFVNCLSKHSDTLSCSVRLVDDQHWFRTHLLLQQACLPFTDVSLCYSTIMFTFISLTENKVRKTINWHNLAFLQPYDVVNHVEWGPQEKLRKKLQKLCSLRPLSLTRVDPGWVDLGRYVSALPLFGLLQLLACR